MFTSANAPRDSYDELPYPCAPYPQTHPEHLATLATLLGLEPPPLRHARILEVGCGDGANLLPLAYSLEQPQLTGIDLSARQVHAGQQLAAQLGLENVRLRVADLRALLDEPAEYDFILAHGVYSWVPSDVRDALLALIHRRLAAHGLALVSYNVLPGWADRLAIRHWLRSSHAAAADGPRLVAAARRQLVQLAGALRGDTSPRGARLRAEIQRLADWNDGYLRHDLLEAHNEPCFVQDFAAHLARHELRFLAEADFPSMLGAGLAPHSAEVAARLPRDTLEREQLLDLLTNREFRQSLIVHHHRSAANAIRPEALAELYVASPLRPTTSVEAAVVRFQTPTGYALESDHPFVTACLEKLGELWPAWISFQALAEQGAMQLALRGETPGPDARRALHNRLATTLLAAFADRAAEIHAAPPRFTLDPSERPSASPLARAQAQSSSLVTNLRHDLVELSAAERQLLPLLNGQHSIASLQLPPATLKRLTRQALLQPNTEN